MAQTSSCRTRVAKQRQELEMVRRFRKAVILLIALCLIAPMSARASSPRYHRSHGHSSHRVHLGHHSYYGLFLVACSGCGDVHVV